MVSRAINTAYSTGGGANGLWRAIVQAVNDNSLNVTIPRLGQNNVYENVPYIGFTPQVGDRIWVGFIEGRSFDPVAFVGATDTSTDITEIIAGTNLNGGGTSGSVTLNLDDNITIDSLQFDITANTAVETEGLLAWNEDWGTVDIGLHGSNAVLRVGQQVYYYAKNQTGSQIDKGTVVRFDGALGASGHLKMAPFLADGTYPSEYIMGVTAHDIPNGDDGYVVHFGAVRGIDTETPNWNAGDLLYVSSTVTGELTSTAPSAPNNIILVAAVVNRHSQNGELFVRPTLSANILNDEAIVYTSLSDNDTLVYNSAVGAFENTPFDHGGLAGLGDDDHTQYLLVDGSRAADTFTVTGDLVVDTDTLFVDASTDRVGIGTTTPGYPLSFGAPADGSQQIALYEAGSAAYGIGTDQNRITLFASNASTYTERMVIRGDTGYVGINDTTPSYMLDVNGTGRFVGQLTASGGIDGLTLANGGISGSNYNITGVNQLEIADPGEGIVFKGGASGDYSMYVIDDASDKILQVGGVTNSRIRVYAPSGNAEVELNTSGVRWALFANASDNSFNLYNTIGSTDFTFTTTGRLGINNLSPSYNLDVSGTGRFTGELISDSYRWGGTSYLTSTTTSALESELLARDVFDSSFSAFKTGWSYAGNGNLTDAGRLTELAGTSWLTWTDNSADNTLGNYTALVIAPNTGGSAGGVFVYNDQGSSYSPGWRELWNSSRTIVGPSGSSSAPAYSFDGDTNTGMYREETDMLGLSAGGEVVGLFRESTNNNSGSPGDGYVAFSTYMGGTTGTSAVLATTTISGQAVKRLMFNSSGDEVKDTPVPWEMSDESYKKIAISSFHYKDMYVDDDGMHHHWDKALALKGEQEDEPPETWVPLKRYGFMWSQLMEHEDLWPLATDLGISDPAVAAATVSVVQRLIDRVASLEARIAALEAE